jgi:hypothetical protein
MRELSYMRPGTALQLPHRWLALPELPVAAFHLRREEPSQLEIGQESWLALEGTKDSGEGQH